ncbi:hypothetical protein HNV08_15420, partial [Winogradskyella eckloniae]|uniref:Ig-like domain-containing protein n=1 Tax=Winogradskyella eckloniae TaxID=1089306 RepID=UPI0019D5B89E
MENKYSCISIEKISGALVVALLLVLSCVLNAQQAPSIRTGVTFQWADVQPDGTHPATIESVTINGQVYNTFAVPSDYEMTRVGPNGHGSNHIKENSTTIFNNSSNALWHDAALSAFQDKNLNHFFSCGNNGRNICSDFSAVSTTDAQKQTIFYTPYIPANEGGVLAITERNANNCFHIAVYGIPVGGTSEVYLGETFVRTDGVTYIGAHQPPNQEPAATSDYWLTDRTVEDNKSLGMALFYLSDIVPVGSKITKIEFNASTVDHGDGKFLILQKYAIDNHQVNCIDTRYSGNLSETNNAPENSTYSLVSGPTETGNSFVLNTDGTYTYEPVEGFTGEVSFVYQLCLPEPNQSVCDQATVYLEFVNLPPDPSFDVSCNTSQGYTIEVTSPLGSEYEYRLNGGAYQTSTTFDVPNGSYNLSIKNMNTSCEKFYLNNPIVLSEIEITADISDVSCKLGNDGAIDISISGGSAPYSYSWSNSATSEDLSNIYANTYTLTVTDAYGCTKSESFEVKQPEEELAVEVDWINHVDCFGNNSGDFKVEGSGGTPPYQYSDDGGVTTQSNDYFAPPYNAGEYTITIIDANGCTSTVDLEITEPDELEITMQWKKNVSCNGGSDGDFKVIGSGGTPPYNYSLDGGTTTQTDQIFYNLSAGDYTVTVIDSNQCTAEIEIEITEPSALSLSVNKVNATSAQGCDDGTATASTTGGNGPYTYLWSASAGNSTDASVSGLTVGNHTVVVTDANDCTATQTITISCTDDCDTATTSGTITNVLCNDDTTGAATVSASSVVNPSATFTFTWSNGDTDAGVTTSTISNVAAGNYTVSVTMDGSSCDPV